MRVLEKRTTVGGACVTDELFDKFRFSTASLVTSLFRREIIDDLELRKYGLTIIPREPSVISLLPDGRHLALGGDEGECVRQISAFSERDAKTYPRYGETMSRLARFVEPYLLGEGRRPLLDDASALRAALVAASGLPDDDLVLLTSVLFDSARVFLDRWFESEELKATLAIDGVTGVDAGPSSPGTAYLMLYHMTGTTETGRPAWGHIRGGMGGLTGALAASATAHGVRIDTGVPVTRVETGPDGAEAVVLADGQRVRGRAIVSAVDPRTTFLDLVPEDATPSGYRHAIAGADFEGVAAKIHLALDRLPAVRGFGAGDTPGPQHRGTLLIAPDLDYLDEAHADARAGRSSARPHVECTIPTVLDDTLAPPGKHVMSMYVQYAPYTLAEGSWDDHKEEFADRVMAHVEEYLPGLGDSVLHRAVFSPLDLERKLGLAGGNLYHGAMSAADLFKGRPVSGYRDYETPVPGLFLCASGTRPGGGVFGVPGRNAAAAVHQALVGDP